MGGNDIAGQSGLSTWFTYRRRKQCNGRTAGASTQGNGSTAGTQSRATYFQSQRRAPPFSAGRRPLAIGRRIAASRAARMTKAARLDRLRLSNKRDVRCWQILLQKSVERGHEA